MLAIFIAHFRAWQLECATIRHLENCDDRMLADIGIDRAAIPTLAASTSRANVPPVAKTNQLPELVAHQCGAAA